MTIGQRIKISREHKGLSQVELADKIKISKQNLYKYENDIITNIPSDKIEDMAKVLEVSPSYLMGWEEKSKEPTIHELPNDKVFMIPIYDSVSAGFGAVAQDYVLGYMPTYITCPSEQEQYLWVNVQGDSMSPLIDDGSKILVKKQTSVDSGQIGVVLIDGEEAVVKKVKYGTDWIELQSINPYYPPRKFTGSDIKKVKILGLVKEVSKTL
ncbi:MAG: helix-turn-helix domain-containing protein [Oscillospiraceae bacterium]|nr:helix-turn-helix domain-containing protein [Oscillospiraceae bacterium]